MTVMMTKDEYRAALERLALTQGEVARLLGTDARTGRRWALGEVAVPGPVEMHLRVWLARPEILDVVRAEADKRDRAEAN